MKIHETDDAALGRMVKDRHARLAAAHAAGLTDEHPATAWNRDSATLRNIRNVGSSKPIEDLDHGTGAEDDPAPTPQTPGVPERNGGGTAVDAAMLEDNAIRHRSGADVEGNLHLARIKRGGSTSTTRRAMADLVPGYDRLK
jgi:hypothetical protein